RLGPMLADHLGVPVDHLWFGGGGANILLCVTLSTTGPGSSVVYAHPSFLVYRLSTAVAGAERVEVPLDGEHRHDIDAMIAAVRDDTRLLYVCNPNNPTGTHVPTSEVLRLLDAVPESVLVVVDEAYHHYVEADDYWSMVSLVDERPNLAVLQTFSKIYGLAGLRIGYLISRPDLLDPLRKTQLPFTATNLAQVAAVAALRHTDRLAERIETNADGRAELVQGLKARGMATADSQTNFVFARLHDDPLAVTEGLLSRGVIIRPTGTAWQRITVGTPSEIAEFFDALDAVVSGVGSP
ncbi:MAG TPA: aminotransferase class I/II-fold pyridoxal phosphate-dependent enzyme, partial [Actinobacteria bacterium]|nr:aminotransferase class I/II-fold pyridoxal phosphate-dependent enzyme [Actinomycetota bacterium]